MLFIPRPRVLRTPPCDTSQLKGFASAALGSDAQQTVQGDGVGEGLVLQKGSVAH